MEDPQGCCCLALGTKALGVLLTAWRQASKGDFLRRGIESP